MSLAAARWRRGCRPDEEINSHFSSPPFQYQELLNPNVHKVLSSYDILGGQATFNVLYTTQKFHDDNPKTYKAFYDALAEAEKIIKAERWSPEDLQRNAATNEALIDLFEELFP